MAIEKETRGRPPKRAEDRKNYKYTVRLDKKTNDKLVKYAKANKQTITETIRASIIKYID